MTFSASKVVSDAWYKSGFVPSDASVDGSSMALGLDELKLLISGIDLDGGAQPFTVNTTVNLVGGQEDYDIEGLVEIISLSYTDGNIRYRLKPTSADAYESNPRIEDLSTFPDRYYARRIPPQTVNGVLQSNGMRISFYPVPNKSYVLNITGKFAQPEITMTTDLSALFPPWMIDYFILGTAMRICEYYDMDCPQRIVNRFNSLESKIKSLGFEAGERKKFLSTGDTYASLRRMELFGMSRGTQ